MSPSACSALTRCSCGSGRGQRRRATRLLPIMRFTAIAATKPRSPSQSPVPTHVPFPQLAKRSTGRLQNRECASSPANNSRMCLEGVGWERRLGRHGTAFPAPSRVAKAFLHSVPARCTLRTVPLRACTCPGTTEMPTVHCLCMTLHPRRALRGPRAGCRSFASSANPML